MFMADHWCSSGLLCLNRRGPRAFAAINHVPARHRAVHPISELMSFPHQFAVSHMRSPFGTAMPVVGVGGKVFGKFFYQMDRPVTATGAADRDRRVFFALLHEPRQD